MVGSWFLISVLTLLDRRIFKKRYSWILEQILMIIFKFFFLHRRWSSMEVQGSCLSNWRWFQFSILIRQVVSWVMVEVGSVWVQSSPSKLDRKNNSIMARWCVGYCTFEWLHGLMQSNGKEKYTCDELSQDLDVMFLSPEYEHFQGLSWNCYWLESVLHLWQVMFCGLL